MLVLTRKSGEGIRIGDDVKVIILEVRDNQIKIGIDAPRDKSVHREEIYQRIQDENIKASKQMPTDIPTTLKRFKKNDP